MLSWEKLGLIWGPDGSNLLAANSALQPTPILLNENVIRVFIGCRDLEGMSRIFYVDVDAANPKIILGYSKTPVLDIGTPGCFDENGVVPCSVIMVNNVFRMFYAGYMCPRRARFIAFSGIAESNDGVVFKRISKVPALERTNEEPLFRAIHSVIYENDVYRVWYGAGDEFIAGRKKTLPSYNIRYLESKDGVSFPDTGSVVIETRGVEYRVGRPSVYKVKYDFYVMFYGYGSEEQAYVLGMAQSRDGLSWERRVSEIGIDLGTFGWDSEMMAYPAVIKTKAGVFMFYNGNNYGESGFGVAKLIGNFNL